MPSKPESVELFIAWVPPSVNKWVPMHWHKKIRVIQEADYAVKEAVKKAGIKKLPYPCKIYTDVYKFKGKVCDAHNLVTPLDKCVIDALTEPQGRKSRGLGLIPDDSPDYVEVQTPVVHIGEGQWEGIRMRFEKVNG